MADVLEGAGHRVSKFHSAAEGLEAAHVLQPDLVLLDIVMPTMNGFQVLRKITRDPGTAHIPVVLVSVKNSESDRVWGMRQGAKDYLGKPFSPDDLLAAVVRNV